MRVIRGQTEGERPGTPTRFDTLRHGSTIQPFSRNFAGCVDLDFAGGGRRKGGRGNFAAGPADPNGGSGFGGGQDLHRRILGPIARTGMDFAERTHFAIFENETERSADAEWV